MAAKLRQNIVLGTNVVTCKNIGTNVGETQQHLILNHVTCTKRLVKLTPYVHLRKECEGERETEAREQIIRSTIKRKRHG